MDFPTTHCLNCRAPRDASHAFCPVCGQKAATHRLTAHEIAHDLLHAFAHVDRGAFAVLKGLAVRPGRIAREFIEGQRKRYFNPFTLLVVVVGVASLIMVSTNFMGGGFGPKSAVSQFLSRNVNLVILLQVPLLALWATLLFWGQRLHYVEHLVLAAYTSSFRSVFFVGVVMPIWLIAAPPALVAVYLVVWMLYFGFASSQFYAGHRAWSFVRGVGVAFLTQLTTFAIIAAIHSLYARLQAACGGLSGGARS
ncbi:MAG: DUF3667 domain-containing protein [Betaproteobacteria bacterium]|nr:DUF3667 domain-containing protein [Betaproteobacteria bacterium]